MGLFSGISNIFRKVVDFAAPVLGGIFGGPVGGAVGSAIGQLAGPAITGAASFAGQNAANQTNQQIADQAAQVNITSAREANALTEKLTNQQIAENRSLVAGQHAENRYLVGQQLGFQQDLSNTAYQRAIADMKSAGLNPILAAQQGGASTPSGSTGSATTGSAASGSGQSASAPITRVEDALTKGLNSAIATKRMFADLEATEQNIRTSRSVARANAETAAKTGAEARLIEEQIKSFESFGSSAIGKLGDTILRGGGTLLDKFREMLTPQSSLRRN